MANDRESLLLRLLDAVQELAGAVIDHVPPKAQDQIADVQVTLIELRRDFPSSR
jgi:hypothetical protein